MAVSSTKGHRAALTVFFLIAILNYVDRTVLAVLQVPIKAELDLSDTQMGLLLGIAFAFVYSFAGLPIGLAADRFDRKRILVGALGLWSALTGAAGFAANFATLAVCRAGVALGEAAGSPITYAIISDMFPKERRSTVVGFLATALPIGMFVGLAGAGQLETWFGWRATLVIIGGIGILLVPVAALFLMDPPRKHLTQAGGPRAFTINELLHFAWNVRTFRYTLIAASLHIFTLHTVLAWNVPFYVRTYELELRDAGFILACLAGIGGVLGSFGGGWLADRGAVRDARWPLWVQAIASACFVPLAFGQYVAPTLGGSVAAGVGATIMLNVYVGPLVAVTQGLTPSRGRTLVAAFVVFIINIGGMSLGPVLAGVISDQITPPANLLPIQLAMIVALLGAVLAVPFYLIAGRHAQADYAAFEQAQGRENHD